MCLMNSTVTLTHPPTLYFYVQYTSLTTNRQKYLNESLTWRCFSADSRLVCRGHTGTASVPQEVLDKCLLHIFWEELSLRNVNSFVKQQTLVSSERNKRAERQHHRHKNMRLISFWPACPQVICTQITTCCLYKVFWALQCNCALPFLLSPHMMLIKMSEA